MVFDGREGSVGFRPPPLALPSPRQPSPTAFPCPPQLWASPGRPRPAWPPPGPRRGLGPGCWWEKTGGSEGFQGYEVRGAVVGRSRHGRRWL